MASWLERAVEGLEKLPVEISMSLRQIRQQDNKNRDFSSQLAEEELQLLEQIQSALKNGEDIDDVMIRSRADALILKRKELSASMDVQVKAASHIYEKLDFYINALDSNVQEINSRLSLTISKQDYSQTKKQKNRKSSSSKGEGTEQAFEIQVQTINDSIDPNEPIYCTCRQVSFGRMVACDSETCKYEWFHFDCVQYPAVEPDKWYCEECLTQMNGDAYANNLMHSSPH